MKSNKRATFVIILLCLLVLPLATRKPEPVIDEARLHPLLVELAAKSPGQNVAVIVQASSETGHLAKTIEKMGGKVTAELRMINALAVDISAGNAFQLAHHPQVRWISLDTPVISTNETTPCESCSETIYTAGADLVWNDGSYTQGQSLSTTMLQNAYIYAIGANLVWNEAPYNHGQNIGVAIVDSGVTMNNDFRIDPGSSGPIRLIAATVVANTNTNNTSDYYGHGTHIAGVIGGNGFNSNGAYIGVAPKVNLINVKVTNDKGSASSSTLVAGLQWVLDNAAIYNIRVVNLAMNSSVLESYHTNPITAAVEVLWFNNIVVVVSAGNTPGMLYPPANDPFVITVGAVKHNNTNEIIDDTIANFSGFGLSEVGLRKPELVAPGKDIISVLASTNSTLYKNYPANRIIKQGRDHYFRMSGTSMAAPVVAGAVALLLYDEPNLNPDQVKYRLMATAAKGDRWPGYDPILAGAGYLDIYAAVNASTTGTANTGSPVSQLISINIVPSIWPSVNWGSVNWGSVNWGSVNWGSVNWGSVNWGSDYWDR